MKHIAILTTMLLTACAAPYQPKGFAGGFDDTQLDSGVFRVTFHGNEFDSAERVEDLSILRSAELAMKNGYTYFGIIDNQSRIKRADFTTAQHSYTTANAAVYGNQISGNAYTTTHGGQTIHMEKPITTKTIACFKEKPDVQAFIYDAKFICSSLGSKYSVVCGEH